MGGVIVAVLTFAVLLSSSAVAEDAFLPPVKEPAEAASQLSSDNVNLLNSEKHNTDSPRVMEPSLELRRLYATEAPQAIPRPKGFPALLASAGLLGHAGVQAVRDWNTVPVPRAWVSLIFGKARFDTTNLALYSLLGGALLLYLGLSRRWTSHKERNLWRVDELLRQDRARIEALRRGSRK